MLKLILGGSGSGKTTLLYHRIRTRAEAGQKSILLVPEQFTSSTEGRIYRELGDALSGMVESFSFTSLAEKILSAEGGSAVQTLSDAGRAVLVRRALEELQDNVRYYYRHRRSAAFCQMAAETIDELKSAGLSGTRLAELAKGCGAESGKLSELALIFQGYETLLFRSGMDPADRLELAGARLEEALAGGEVPGFLRGREVFIDEFDTFNAPKKRLLGAMLAALPCVTVALCDDGAPLLPGDVSLFSGAKQVAVQLRQLARKNGAEVAAPELLRRDLRHAAAPGLAAVTELLETGVCPPLDAPADEVRLFAAPSREEEARAAAGAIRRLMRQGVRCGKIAVVCRDIAKYRAAVRYEFRMADIPLYCDEPTTPEFSAPATAVRALLALLRGADMTEQLTVLAKTGLCDLTEPEVCALENYAYTWSPNAAAWRAEFTKSPRGFGDAELTEEDTQNLTRAENARKKLVTAVDTLRSKVRSANAEQISRALYFCLKELGAEGQQTAQVEDIRTARGIPAAEEAAREWNVVMQLLDEMARLLGSQGITVPEYEDLFSLLLRSSDLGHIPQTLDAVVLASAGKMRLDAPDYVFVLGLAEGEFPCAPSETGLLTHADRDALMAKQIDLPDCFENRVVREQVCFYKALTVPAKGLWLSWPKGQGKTLCAALEPIVEALHPAAPELELPDLAATPADALDTLGGWPLTDTERASLTEALRLPQTDAPRGLALLQRMEEDPPRQVNDLSALSGLLGQRLRISPSQLEKYYTCRYGYFLQYVLGLRPRRRAELSADQSGTLMHWVLQMALDPHPDADNPCAGLAPFLELDDEAMAGLASLLVDEYAKRYLPEDTARFAYLLSRLKKSMTSLLCYLRDEQKQSCFHPAACELRIGSGEDAVPGQVYHLSDGRTVQLVGTVDRADEWVEEDGTRWVRVVDYKTGTKKLNLKEVYCGLDCQMLLYLFSLTRDKSGRFTGAEPAGVLYLLADPAPKTTNRQQAQQDVQYELDGLVRDEQKVFDAMDADETGRYLPFGYRNGVPSPSQKDKRADIAKLNRIQLHLDDLVTQMGQQLYDGQIAAEPLVAGAGRNPCVWCDYSFICCHETGIGERALEAPAKPFEPEETENEKEGEQA